jgi:hypothetical protein
VSRISLDFRSGSDPTVALLRVERALAERIGAAPSFGPLNQLRMTPWHRRDSHGGEVRFEVAHGVADRATRAALTNLCLEAIDRTGVRLRGLRFLGWERGAPMRPVSTLEQLSALAQRRADPAFAARFLALLEHDVAVGVSRHPELLLEFHTSVSPEAELALRWSMGDRTPLTRPFWLSSVLLGFGDRDSLLALAQELAERDWLTQVHPAQHPSLGPAVSAMAGPKLRRISEPETIPIR